MADRRRALIDALKEVPSKHRAWLVMPVSVEGFELFCFHGWGIVPNDAQLESIDDIIRWPRGTFHLWKFANRAGKTTGLILAHLYFAFKKWHYEQVDLDAWTAYRYKTLHAAPQGILMGKAWEIADSLNAGASIMQRNPQTNAQRPGIFVKSGLFDPTTSKSKDGSDLLLVRIANGAQVDFLQTYSGAGRMESDAWWFITWDEFGEHQPVSNVPYLVDSTFLPRASDFQASVVLSSTEKDHNAMVYAELEDLAERSPGDWNVKTFGRSVNFAQSTASMDRQRRMSSDSATAQRSVDGGSAESSKGSILPLFTIRRAFDPALPAHRTLDDLGPAPNGKKWKLVQAFDHAITGDRSVVTSIAVPWPILDREELIHFPAVAIDIEQLKSSRVLTPDELVKFALRQWKRHNELPGGGLRVGSVWLTDTTGEGGIMVHRMIRPAGIPSREFNFTARVSKTDRRTRKAHGRSGLQRLFGLGLPVDDDGRILVPAGVQLEQIQFGGIRLPLPSPEQGPVWRRLWRELGLLRIDDANLAQDHAMTVLMVAGFVYPYIERGQRTHAQPVNVLGRRTSRAAGAARARRGLAPVR